MTSDSPKTRINQFYASKKRKPTSPAPKVGRTEKGARLSAEGSSKGTLPINLVGSKELDNGIKAASEDQGPKTERNLLSEVNRFPGEDNKDLYSSVQWSSKGDTIRKETSQGSSNAGNIAIEGALKGCSISGAHAENLELKQFATDFLSLYCSELQSTATSPSKENLNDNKKHSNKLSEDGKDRAPKKRLYIPNQLHPRHLVACSTKNKAEDMQSTITPENKVCVGASEQHQSSLSKCDKMSKLTVNSTDCCTPGPPNLKAYLDETPKSARGSSMFSPGEAFWCEAIQVADGIVADTDNALTLVSMNDGNNGDNPRAVVGEAESRSQVMGNGSYMESVVKNHIKISSEEVSPLPVKHLNFLFDEKASNSDIQHGATKSSETSRDGKQSASLRAGLKHCQTTNILKSLCKAGENQEVHGVKQNIDSSPDNEAKVSVFNNSHGASETPSSLASFKDRLDIINWLPSEVECLQVDGVLQRRNLVYSASTSAGKSFVAEILMLRRVISMGKIAILVLPYVSLCAEKAEHLESLLEPLGKHVRSFYGNQGGATLPKDTSVAVCTIEKANFLINRLLEEGRLLEIGIIVIDELHMVGDQSRGYLLELMLTKLRYATGEGNSESSSGDSSGTSSKGDPTNGLQIVGMSATMPNVGAVADWLQAALYQTDFRPVPLVEYIKVGNTIYDKELNIIRTISKVAELCGKDPDHIVALCDEVVQEGHSVLIFCSSRKGCESTARHVAKFLKGFSVNAQNDSDFVDISAAIDALQRCPVGLDPVLAETLPCGVAYHHAGLTVEEREIIETCYRRGLVRVLTATSTLAAGIVLDDLSRAREAFVLASDLHLVYLVTPTNVDVEPDWEVYYGRFVELSAIDQESPVAEVCEAFKVARGMVQALQENSGRFASMVTLFCERLGWHDLEGLVSKFQNRVSFGVRAEIVELTTIPHVKGSRARALYKAGLRSPLAIAEASIPDIVKALFETSTWSTIQECSAQRRVQLGVAKKIKNGARKIVLEKAEEARMAALSAFQSLGLSVPQLSRPLQYDDAQNPIEHRAIRDEKTGMCFPAEQAQLLLPKLAGVAGKTSVKIGSRGEGHESAKTLDFGPACMGGVALSSPLHSKDIVHPAIPIRSSILKSNPNGSVDGNISADAVVAAQLGQNSDLVQGHRYISRESAEQDVRQSSGNKEKLRVKGPIYASSVSGGFDSFLDLWDATWEFYFDIHYTKLSRINPAATFDIHGIAICWEKSPVYYIKLPRDLLQPEDKKNNDTKVDEEVKKRLSSEAIAAANWISRWKNQMRGVAHNGCCRRVAQIRALSSVLWKLLISEGLLEPLNTIEIPLVNVLAEMEIWGVGVDMEGCIQARTLLGKKIRHLEKEAHELAGVKFSLNTPADIAHILFSHLKLPLPERHIKGKQHPSTDKHCLDWLRHEHPVIPVIKEHRTLAKLLNSTLGSICSLGKLSISSQKYTIHGRWLQTSTATGRLSMEEPNLQCVEHMVDFKMRTDESGSKTAVGHYKINARDFFVPTQENWLLLTADYSQIELRLMAHFSMDTSLVDLLSKPQSDVFTMIAAKWTGKSEVSVGSDERDHTKRLVYGILYGMGANSLAEQLDCSPDEAAEKIRSFKHSFPGVASWLKEVVSSCRDKGYVETLKGRKRFLSKIKLGNSEEKAKAQRQSVNSICQGSAADIIKIAMITLHSVIFEETDGTDSYSSLVNEFHMLKGRCRILLQVHDELVLEADPSVIKEAASLLQRSMENAVLLRGSHIVLSSH
ncbi:Helicase and polymerase-containing protein TEBICHI [Linum perenne]